MDPRYYYTKLWERLSNFYTCIDGFLRHLSRVSEKKAWFIKRWLLQGIAVALPIVITVVILYYSVIYADSIFWFIWDMLPWDLLPWEVSKPHFPGVGLIVVVSLLTILGFLTESWLINKGFNIFNLIMSKLPFIRNIYSTALKVVQSTVGNTNNFSSVVLIEFPMEGIHAVAFKTSKSSEVIKDATGKELINIFLPTTPNPTSGFYLMVPEDKIIETDITTEEAFKLIISAGIVQK